MNRNIRTFLGICTLLLFPVFACAETITTNHVFQTMNKSTELIFSNSYTTAETNLLTYQCTGKDAKFDRYGGSTWSIVLPSSSSKYVTTTCINELSGFTIGHYPSSKNVNIKVYVSKDGSTWSSALSGDSITYYSGTIDVSLPRNNYYVRIKNISGSEIYLLNIIWYQDHCNCFLYEPE